MVSARASVQSIYSTFERIQTHRPLTFDLFIASLVCSIPLFLTRHSLLQPGYAMGGEVFLNLVPPLHIRQALAAGQFPWIAPWFDGPPIWANPMFKGFYPPAWPLYIPWIPLQIALKIVFAVHLAAIPFIAYWLARRDVRPLLAAPYALIWVFIAWPHFQGGQLEKLFAFPFVVLAVHQALPWRLTDAPRRHGLIAGGALGAMFLAGGMYYAFYVALLLAGVVLATRAWTFARNVALGSLVGVPHLITVIPSLTGGTDRPPVSHALDPVQQIVVITGLHPFIDIVPTHLVGAGYATIGITGLAVAGSGVWIAVKRGGGDERWATGVVSVGWLGMLLGMGFAPLYLLPGVAIFRAAGRATDLIAFACLLLSLYALREVWTTRRLATQWGVAALLLVAAITGAAAQPAYVDFDAEEPTEARAVAAVLDENDCDSVWLEHVHAWGGKLNVRPAKLLFATAERGIWIRGGHYADIGQTWRVHTASGDPTFEALVVGRPPPTDTARLTKPFDGDRAQTLGTVNMTHFERIATVPLEESGANAYIYAHEGSCRD